MVIRLRSGVQTTNDPLVEIFKIYLYVSVCEQYYSICNA